MEWVNFKVKEGERERIKKDAYRHEMNISEYLRFLVEKERERMNNAENEQDAINKWNTRIPKERGGEKRKLG